MRGKWLCTGKRFLCCVILSCITMVINVFNAVMLHKSSSMDIDNVMVTVNNTIKQTDNVNVTPPYSTSSIQARDQHIFAFQQKPRNCSLKQAAVTRFPLKSDKTTGYITLYQYRGGLGNQLFQLASLIGIASQTNLTPVLCYNNINNDNNNFLPTEVFDLSNITIKPCYTDLELFHKYQESDHAIYKKVSIDSNYNWTIDGYFQSFKYFNACTKLIREIFKIKQMFINEAKTFLEARVPPNSVIVCIHVRRKDFISKYQKKLGRVAPNIGYTHRAMQLLETQYSNITYIVISDDRPWCRANLLKGDRNVLLSPFKHEGGDLALASLSHHIIITVGTFSWWAGWLCTGQVIYYNNYPRPGSIIDQGFSKHDYYPSTWIPLS